MMYWPTYDIRNEDGTRMLISTYTGELTISQALKRIKEMQGIYAVEHAWIDECDSKTGEMKKSIAVIRGGKMLNPQFGMS